MSSRAPSTEKGRRTRERIVQAAVELVAERGAAAVSLDDVGSTAPASRSQLYHYFDDRDDLIRAVVDATCDARCRSSREGCCSRRCGAIPGSCAPHSTRRCGYCVLRSRRSDRDKRASALKRCHAHRQWQTAPDQQPESPLRHGCRLRANHRKELVLEVVSRMTAQDLLDIRGGDVPDPQPRAINHRSPLQVAAELSVALDVDAGCGVSADSVSESLRTTIVHSSRGRTRERSVRARKREVVSWGGLGDPMVVQQRAAIEQLDIELAPVDSGESASEQPRPMGVAHERCRQFGARLLGLSRKY